MIETIGVPVLVVAGLLAYVLVGLLSVRLTDRLDGPTDTSLARGIVCIWPVLALIALITGAMFGTCWLIAKIAGRDDIISVD
jgi:hypothetical protein